MAFENTVEKIEDDLPTTTPKRRGRPKKTDGSGAFQVDDRADGGVVKVVRLAWLTESLSKNVVLPLDGFLLYQGRKVGSTASTGGSSRAPVQTLRRVQSSIHDQSSISDSEQEGYAASVAPNHLTRRRPESHASRIPGPVENSESEPPGRNPTESEGRNKEFDACKPEAVARADFDSEPVLAPPSSVLSQSSSETGSAGPSGPSSSPPSGATNGLLCSMEVR